jgi:hypothetical protein
MESNRGEKRTANSCEDCNQKRLKLAHDGIDIWTATDYLPPQRAPRTGGLLNGLNTNQAFGDIAKELIIPKNDYVYKPLDADSIRLLYILPGDDSQTIRASLEHVQLATAKPYEALSYVWGQDPATNAIHVDDKAFHIGGNLFQALHRIRMKERPVYLWVDAVCINQKGEREKGIQVQNMGEIYKKADKVLI